MDKVSMSYLFSFSGYQTKCVIEFSFRQLMTSWTLRFIFDHPLKQWLTGTKRGKDRNTKNWTSRERKGFFFTLKNKFNYTFQEFWGNKMEYIHVDIWMAWGYSRKLFWTAIPYVRERVLPMQLGCTRSCEHRSASVQMHSSGKVH